jgi:hypothetical protein
MKDLKMHLSESCGIPFVFCNDLAWWSLTRFHVVTKSGLVYLFCAQAAIYCYKLTCDEPWAKVVLLVSFNWIWRVLHNTSLFVQSQLIFCSLRRSNVKKSKLPCVRSHGFPCCDFEMHEVILLAKAQSWSEMLFLNPAMQICILLEKTGIQFQ